MTLKDQVAVAHALRLLTGSKGWTKTANNFAEMEERLDAELSRAEADAAQAAETARVQRCRERPGEEWRSDGVAGVVMIPASHPCPHADECADSGRECPCAAMGV